MSFSTTGFDDLRQEIKNKPVGKDFKCPPSIQFGALRQQRKFSKLNTSTIYSLKTCSHNWVSTLFGLGTQLQWSVLTIT